MIRRFILALLAILAVAAAPARAALPPRPQGPVLDQAAVIPDPQEVALDQKLRAYTQATGRSVVVATVSTLDGLEVEDYAQQLAESWDIGGAKTEEGVLLLVAPAERKLRIHAARGVQDRLTDALSGRIIRDTMAPRFKAGDFGSGIVAGVDQIVAQLDRSPADAKAIAEAAAAAGRGGEQGTASFGSAIFWIMLIVFFMFVFGRGRKHGGRRARRSGIDPAIMLWGASEIAHHMSRGGGGGWGGGGSGGGGFDGFGGFGGGGGGFDGGGASGDW